MVTTYLDTLSKVPKDTTDNQLKGADSASLWGLLSDKFDFDKTQWADSMKNMQTQQAWSGSLALLGQVSNGIFMGLNYSLQSDYQSKVHSENNKALDNQYAAIEAQRLISEKTLEVQENIAQIKADCEVATSSIKANAAIKMNKDNAIRQSFYPSERYYGRTVS